MQATRSKLSETISFRATTEMVSAAEMHRALRGLEKASDAQREIFGRGLEVLRGDTAQILDAARLVRGVGLNPVEVLRQAFERTVPCTFVEVAQ